MGGAGCASPFIKVHLAEANHKAERSRPGEPGKLRDDIGIGLEFQPFGTGSDLILVNHERARESHAVIPKLPAACFAICRSCKGPPPKHQQVATATEKPIN